jgi:hypothetical protein
MWSRTEVRGWPGLLEEHRIHYLFPKQERESRYTQGRLTGRDWVSGKQESADLKAEHGFQATAAGTWSAFPTKAKFRGVNRTPRNLDVLDMAQCLWKKKKLPMDSLFVEYTATHKRVCHEMFLDKIPCLHSRSELYSYQYDRALVAEDCYCFLDQRLLGPRKCKPAAGPSAFILR